MADNRFFTNTYTTGSGRRNYLAIDELEDPLFTSFTFDIDYVTSPLFYTIKPYGSSTAEGLGSEIETSLKLKHGQMSDSYDILPVYSAIKMGDDKLGFGLQQNVYMDKPIYGATEYIYMVDKRNGTNEQNDVQYSGNIGNPKINSGYTLGNTVNSVVNESDMKWAQEQKKNTDAQIAECDEIMEKNKAAHDKNIEELNNSNKSIIDLLGMEEKEGGYTPEEFQEAISKKEQELLDYVSAYTQVLESFETHKKDIIVWINEQLSIAQSKVVALFSNDEYKCIHKIATYDDISNESKRKERYEELKDIEGSFVENQLIGYINKVNDIFDELVTFVDSNSGEYKSQKENDNNSIVLGQNKVYEIRPECIWKEYNNILVAYGFKESDLQNNKVVVKTTKSCPDNVKKLQTGFVDFVNSCVEFYKSEKENYNVDDKRNIIDDYPLKTKNLMSFQCDSDALINLESSKIKSYKDKLAESEKNLKDFRIKMFGQDDKEEPLDKNSPSKESLYSTYLEKKDICENDEYSQAEKTKQVAESDKKAFETLAPSEQTDDGGSEPGSESTDGSDSDGGQKKDSTTENTGNPPPQSGIQSTSTPKPAFAPQTVLDMVGFISGMKKLTINYPYVIQGITGLDTAYKNHYMIKDPYCGSGDDKITLTCLESLDLRVSSMFNRYFNAVYDRQYRRERVPVNLRRFNCYVYVHDVRNFVANSRSKYDNRVLELTDMYYSVIEFRFYDCEIVPEETGNIFDNISNEAPSDMKKTNFTFTYGNCVVNFVPNSEVKAHGS